MVMVMSVMAVAEWLVIATGTQRESIVPRSSEKEPNTFPIHQSKKNHRATVFRGWACLSIENDSK